MVIIIRHVVVFELLYVSVSMMMMGVAGSGGGKRVRTSINV